MANVMLLHGAWESASAWRKVASLLEEAGHRATSPELPLASMAEDVAVVRRALSGLDGPVVLVGHSYGGVPASVVAAEGDGVVTLVFVAAMALEEEETFNDVVQRFGPTEVLAHVRPEGDRLALDPAAYPAIFAPDLDPAEAEALAAAQRPIAASILGERPGAAGWRNVPSAYVVAEDDLVLSPHAQRFMAERSGAEMTSLPASHALHCSRARDVADAIHSAATARHTV